MGLRQFIANAFRSKRQTTAPSTELITVKRDLVAEVVGEIESALKANPDAPIVRNSVSGQTGHDPNGAQVGVGNFRPILAGAYGGGWSSDHRTEAFTNKHWNYVAIEAMAHQFSKAKWAVYQDGVNSSRNQSIRKSLRLQTKSYLNWRSVNKAYVDPEQHGEELPGDHPLVRLMSNPNPFEPGTLFRHRQVQQIRLTGTCYVWNVPSQAGPTCERYVVPTAAMTFMPANEKYPLGYYKVQPTCSRFTPMSDSGFVNGMPSWVALLGCIVDARQIQKIYYPHAIWLDDGQSPVGACDEWVDQQTAINTARTAAIQNGLHKTIVWTLNENQNPNQDEIDRIQEALQDKFSGPMNVGGVIVAKNGTVIAELGHKPDEMGFEQGFEDNRKSVLSIHNTPEVAIGWNGQGAYAAWVVSMKAWRTTGIQPLCDMFAEFDTFYLAPQFGEGYTIDCESDSIQDDELKLKEDTLIVNSGAFKVDEVRKRFNYEPLGGEEGEKLLNNKADAAQAKQDMMGQPGQPGQAGMPGNDQSGQMPNQSPLARPETFPHVPDVPFGGAKESTMKAAIAGAELADLRWRSVIKSGGSNRSVFKSERWITIKPGGDESEAYVHIKIDGDGKIVAGPHHLADKGITHVSDFGKHSDHDEAVEGMKPHAHEYLLDQHASREQLKKAARKVIGKNAGVLAKIENAHRDYSSVPGFDAAARNFAEENPDAGLDPDDHETPAKVWELVREGSKRKPTIDSPEVHQLATEWAHGSRHVTRKPSTSFDPSEWESNGFDDWDAPVHASTHKSLSAMVSFYSDEKKKNWDSELKSGRVIRISPSEDDDPIALIVERDGTIAAGPSVIKSLGIRNLAEFSPNWVFKSWDESKHPRGDATNAGHFAHVSGTRVQSLFDDDEKESRVRGTRVRSLWDDDGDVNESKKPANSSKDPETSQVEPPAVKPEEKPAEKLPQETREEWAKRHSDAADAWLAKQMKDIDDFNTKHGAEIFKKQLTDRFRKAVDQGRMTIDQYQDAIEQGKILGGDAYEKAARLEQDYKELKDRPLIVPEPEGKTPYEEPKPVAAPPEDAPPSKEPETPRQISAAAQKKLDEDYEFARQSSIPNMGADVKGSARHKRNAWRGLAEAEADGTAKEMVTRENLLKAEPPKFSETAEKNGLTTLSMHYMMRSFPAKPGYRDSEATAKDREDYVTAYQDIKKRAEELAESETDPNKALRTMSAFISNRIKELRAREIPDPKNPQWMVKDHYNKTANGLIAMQNACHVGGRPAKNSVLGKMNDFAKAASNKYGAPPSEADRETKVAWMKNVESHVLDIIEGKSLPESFGKKGEKKETFTAADMYVKHAERVGGPDVSKLTSSGKVAAEALVKDYGIRGVQWGNSVTDDERHHHAGKVVEAMADLADVLGIKPQDVSLDGRLSLAIGARGHGSALAHYEPSMVAINLTRASGVGSLAHEWGHGFDHSQMDFSTGRGGAYYASESYDATPAMKEIHSAFRESGFVQRLHDKLQDMMQRGLMSEKTANYWASSREMFARCFEQYVQHKLAEDGRKNTYLSGLSAGGGLWPTADEMQKLAPKFDALFAEFREKKYGNAAKVSQTKAQIVHELQAIFGLGDMKAFNPSEPRDKKGEWTSGGVAAPEVSESTRQFLNNNPVVNAMRKLEPGADHGALVGIRDLRKESGLDESTFDSLMSALSKMGVISLHRHDYPSSLSEKERGELLALPSESSTAWRGNDYFVGAAIRQNGPHKDFPKSPAVTKAIIKENEEPKPHKFSTTQIDLPGAVAAVIQRYAATIDPNDLAEDGIETDSHVTVLYGIETEEPAVIAAAIGEFPSFAVLLGETDIFPAADPNTQRGGNDFDVLKISVGSSGGKLHELRAKLESSVANVQKFPDYKPHVTIAYLKPGAGQKYVGALGGWSAFVAKDVTFSNRERERTQIPLLPNADLPECVTEQKSIEGMSSESVADGGGTVLKSRQMSLWDESKHPRGHEGNAGQFSTVQNPTVQAANDDKPSGVPSEELFKRSGQQFENIQYGLGIKRPKMGTEGVDAVNSALLKHPGGNVISALLCVDGSQTAYDRNGFADRGMDAFREAIDGKFSRDELKAAKEWLETTFNKNDDLQNVNQYRWLSGTVATSEPKANPAVPAVATPFGHLEKKLDDLGISHAIHEKGDVITVSKIVVPKEKRDQGIGTQAMQAIIDYADESGKRIALSPDSSFGGSKKRLTEFYKRFGFKDNKGRSIDHAISESMIREPKPKSATKSFDETKHPRGHLGNAGQFSSNGGAGAAKTETPAAPQLERPQESDQSGGKSPDTVWAKHSDDHFSMATKLPGIGKAAATLVYGKDNTSHLQVDHFEKDDGAGRGSGKELLRQIVKEAEKFKPSTISGTFTTPEALGAFGSEFGRENIVFQAKGGFDNGPVSFERAMQNPDHYVATAQIGESRDKVGTKSGESDRTVNGMNPEQKSAVDILKKHGIDYKGDLEDLDTNEITEMQKELDEAKTILEKHGFKGLAGNLKIEEHEGQFKPNVDVEDLRGAAEHVDEANQTLAKAGVDGQAKLTRKTTTGEFSSSIDPDEAQDAVDRANSTNKELKKSGFEGFTKPLVDDRGNLSDSHDHEEIQSQLDMIRHPEKHDPEDVEDARSQLTEHGAELKGEDWKKNGVESKTFKNWFGQSKVVDENGKPLVLYKGMHPYDWNLSETRNAKGEVIEPAKPGHDDPLQVIERGTEFPSFNRGEPGVKVAGFFGDKETANRFARDGAVYPVYLKIENPFEMDAKGEKAGNIQFGPSGLPFREAIRSGEYDGVIIRNTEDEGDIYIALKAEQIKSALANRGTFDPKDKNITKSLDGADNRRAD